MMTILLLGDVIEKVKGNTETTDTLQSGQLKMEVKKKKRKDKGNPKTSHNRTFEDNLLE